MLKKVKFFKTTMLKKIAMTLFVIYLFPFSSLRKSNAKSRIKRVKKILIFYPSGLGNIVMLTPFLINLRRNFKKSEIDFILLNNGAKELIEKFKIKPIEISPEILQKPLKFIKLILEMRQRRYDIIFFPFPNGGMKFVIASVLAQIPIIVCHELQTGFIKRNKCFLTFTTQLKKEHDTDKNIALLKSLNLNVTREKLFLKITPKENLDTYLKKFEHRKKIALHLGNKEYKNWGEENFEKLIALIKKDFDCVIFLLGKKEDKFIKEAIDLREKMNIDEITYFISKMDLMIGNDTGLMHIAEAVGTPFIVIFGPTDEKRIGPYTPSPNFISICKDLPCRPCYEIGKPVTCKHRKCLSEIKVEEVYKTAYKILTNSR